MLHTMNPIDLVYTLIGVCVGIGIDRWMLREASEIMQVAADIIKNTK